MRLSEKALKKKQELVMKDGRQLKQTLSPPSEKSCIQENCNSSLCVDKKTFTQKVGSKILYSVTKPTRDYGNLAPYSTFIVGRTSTFTKNIIVKLLAALQMQTYFN